MTVLQTESFINQEIRMKFLIGLLSLSLFFIMNGCSSPTSSQTAKINIDIQFYGSAVATTPVLKAKTNLLPKKSAMDTFHSGVPTYRIFNAFREYIESRDQGVIDQSNVYKVLSDVDGFIQNALDSTTPHTGTFGDSIAAYTVESPFNFGTVARKYSFVSDHFALQKSGDTIFSLLTWTWERAGENQKTYGATQASFNNATGDMEVDLVALVDYTSMDDYCYRMYIHGNKVSHKFDFKYVGANGVTSSGAVSMIGSGISKSANNNDYFIIKMIDNNQLTTFTNGRYYKFSVSSNEDSLRAYAVTGYDKATIEDPDNYIQKIDSMNFWALNGSDNATKVSDFKNSSINLNH
jgi:hypothetical protein